MNLPEQGAIPKATQPVAQPSFVYVEDDLPSREVMRILLTKVIGFTNVTIFESGQDFIGQLDQLTIIPDVILLDIHVQPVDGISLFHILRSIPAYQKTKIVAVTAGVTTTESTHLREIGFNALISKPI